ncbi:hypothetical protein VE03_07905 [Pseudogymnoascus sp. 23342-1-I1]|nr:hypothetical protein VE03_07905 [Pseudogymnoascus sp. 23342-1-I1]
MSTTISSNRLMIQLTRIFGHANALDEENAIFLEDLSVRTWRSAVREVISNVPLDMQDQGGNYDQYYAWYWEFLEREWAKVPAEKQDVVVGGNPSADHLHPRHLAKLYEILTFLAHGLTHQDRPALSELTAQVENKGFFKSNTGGDDGGVRNQLVFIAIGWLTMLFEPNLSPQNGSISVQPTLDTKGQIMSSDIFDTISATLSETRGIPLHQLLKHFGTLIPTEFWTHRHTNNWAPDTFSEQIVVSCINYRTLYRIAGIKLEFTSSASLHLDFDERTKTIKIFQYPSFCMMVASGISSTEIVDSQHYAYLNRLFQDYLRGNMVEMSDQDRTESNKSHEKIDIRAFYLEILMSYRLIFGQNRGSWKLFSSHHKKRNFSDPLLLRLCAKNCRKEMTYSESFIPQPKPQYSVRKDFAFFGERLVHLQRFVIEQDPGDFWTLWYDKRDILRYYTFWAVIWVGGVSLLLSLAQNVIGILQLRSSKNGTG